MSNQNNQLSLLEFGGLTDPNIQKIFGKTEIKNSKGVVVGFRVGQHKRKEIGEAFGLTSRDSADDLTDKILQGSDEMLRAAKGEMARLNGNWTLKNFAKRTVAKGETQITLVIREVKRGKVITAEQIMKAWNVTKEEAEAIIKANMRIGSPVIEMEPATETKPDLTQEEKDAAEIARMEREEAERVAATQNA